MTADRLYTSLSSSIITMKFSEDCNTTTLDSTKVLLVDTTTGASIISVAIISSNTLTIVTSGAKTAGTFTISAQSGLIYDLAGNPSLATSTSLTITYGAAPVAVPKLDSTNAFVDENTSKLVITGKFYFIRNTAPESRSGRSTTHYAIYCGTYSTPVNEPILLTAIGSLSGSSNTFIQLTSLTITSTCTNLWLFSYNTNGGRCAEGITLPITDVFIPVSQPSSATFWQTNQNDVSLFSGKISITRNDASITTEASEGITSYKAYAATGTSSSSRVVQIGEVKLQDCEELNGGCGEQINIDDIAVAGNDGIFKQKYEWTKESGLIYGCQSTLSATGQVPSSLVQIGTSCITTFYSQTIYTDPVEYCERQCASSSTCVAFRVYSLSQSTSSDNGKCCLYSSYVDTTYITTSETNGYGSWFYKMNCALPKFSITNYGTTYGVEKCKRACELTENCVAISMTATNGCVLQSEIAWGNQNKRVTSNVATYFINRFSNWLTPSSCTTSTTIYSGTCSNLIDNNLSTNAIFSMSSSSASVDFDLGEVLRVSKIKLFKPYGSDTSAYKTILIQTSNDKSVWTTISTISSLIYASGQFEIYDGFLVASRYWRLKITEHFGNSNGVKLTEVSFFINTIAGPKKNHFTFESTETNIWKNNIVFDTSATITSSTSKFGTSSLSLPITNTATLPLYSFINKFSFTFSFWFNPNIIPTSGTTETIISDPLTTSSTTSYSQTKITLDSTGTLCFNAIKEGCYSSPSTCDTDTSDATSTVTICSSTNSITANSWNNIILSLDRYRRILTLYINGIAVARKDYGFDMTLDFRNPFDDGSYPGLRFGNPSSTITMKFDDVILIYGDALTSSTSLLINDLRTNSYYFGNSI